VAIINQVPSGQPTISAGIQPLGSMILSDNVYQRITRRFADSATALVNDTGGIPVSGQIWPLGLF
jgi:hypothetical protein